MKNIYLIFAICLPILFFPQFSNAQAPACVWAHGFGTAGGYDEGKAVAVDAAGNVYTAGIFTGEAYFGSFTLISQGYTDYFVMKQDPTGAVIWAFGLGDASTSGNITGIGVDGSGNVYIAGTLSSSAVSLDMDPSAGVFPLATNGFTDILVAKYDGNQMPSSPTFFQWAFNAGSTGAEEANDLVVSPSGVFHITGYFNNTVDMDPSGNTNNVTSTGSYECFVARYDGSLTPSDPSFYQWSFSIGGGSLDRGYALAVDAAGMLYVTGSMRLTADMDPSVNVNNITAPGGEDIFVAKYDGTLLPSNTSFYQWAFAVGGAGSDNAENIAVDAGGNVYITGNVNVASADMDPSVNVNALPAGAGGTDIFVAMYDGNLQPSNTSFYKWAFSAGGAGFDRSYDIALDAAGDLYICGMIFDVNPIDMDPSAGTFNLTGAGSNDVFVAKYDPALLPSNASFLQWAVAFGDEYGDVGQALTIDNSSNVLLTGSVSLTNSIDMDPSANTNNLSGLFGSSDVLVSKFDGTLLPSNTSHYKWATSFGSAGTNAIGGYDVAMDAFGNVYATGLLSGSVDMDPGPGVSLLNMAGQNAFVVKYGPAGNLIWAFNAGDYNAGLIGYDMAVDANGYIYVSGRIAAGPTGTADMDPSANTNTISCLGNYDIFIAKYNGNLTPSNPAFFQWAFSVGNTQQDEPIDLEVDDNGYVYITGWTYAGPPVDMDPSVNVNTITSAGGMDAYVAKYNGNLDPSNTSFFQWAFPIGGTSTDRGTSLDIDQTGYLYVTGRLGGTSAIDLDPSANVNTITPVNNDAFVVKYNANLLPTDPGFYQWAFGLPYIQTESMKLDGNGKLYITGGINGITSTDMDPSVNVSSLISTAGYTDIMNVAYDVSFNPTDPSFYLWSFAVPGTGGALGKNVNTDALGNIYVTGEFAGGATDLDPSANSNIITGASTYDIFVACYDDSYLPSSTSFYKYGFPIAGSGNDWTPSLVPDGTGSFYMAGTYSGTNVDFDPTGATLYQSTLPNIYFPFVARYGTVFLPVSQITLEAGMQGDAAFLSWFYEGEESPVQYKVERNDGSGFVEIGRTESTTFSDMGIRAGAYYYRVVGLDMNGGELHSNIAEVITSGAEFVSIYPNPAADGFNVLCPGTIRYIVFDALGQRVMEGEGQDKVWIDAHDLGSGVYFLTVNQSRHKLIVK